jgi:hypothetical protein
MMTVRDVKKSSGSEPERGKRLDPEVLAETETLIRLHVWSGFFDPGQVAELINEHSMYEPEEIDQEWLLGQIDAESRRKAVDELTWPSVTDCDRLDQVFERLNASGVLALQNYGWTLASGLWAVESIYAEAGAERSPYVGYCFYHGQDVARAMDSGELMLAFGALPDPEADSAYIGSRTQTFLREAGFVVEWDGSTLSRLLIREIRWQRRLAKG